MLLWVPSPELLPAFAHNACVAANAPQIVNSLQRPSFQANHWNGAANKKSYVSVGTPGRCCRLLVS